MHVCHHVRIDLAHLAWTLSNVLEDSIVNEIKVDPEIAHHSLVALERMLEVK